jgi:tetratricopeptide (TPR) repeat protein
VATGEPLTPSLVHPGEVYHAAISPRGGLVVTACETGGAWLWATPEPDARSAADLEKLAGVLSGQRLDPRLGPVPVAHGVLETDLATLRAQYPDQFQRSTERLAAWHRFEVDECEAVGNWSAAAWHLDRLLANRPTDWALLVRRGHVDYSAGNPARAAERFAEASKLGPRPEVHAAVRERADQYRATRQWPAALWYLNWLVTERPDEAALYVQRAAVYHHQNDVIKRTADLVKAVELGAGGGVPAQLATVRAADGKWVEAARLLALARERGQPQWSAHALACLKAGDRDGYRRVCEARIADASAGGGPDDANQAAWLCVLAPGAVPDLNGAVKLVEGALATSLPEMRAGYLNTLGAILYRAGRHRDAIARLQEGIKLSGLDGLEDWVFLGLAHHALGETEEARRLLDRVRAAPQPGGAFSWAREEQQFLREQIEAALAPPK